MELGPIERIGAIRAVVKRGAKDVAPPFAIDETSRTDEYSAGADQPAQHNRDLEEDDPAASTEADDAASDSTEQGPPKTVNLFA